MNFPLEGYRIIDFGIAWADPLAGQLLADSGAEVIKVETKGRLDSFRLGRPIVGDDITAGDRGGWPELQPLFHSVNRSKLSITVNLKTPEGLALMKDLVRKSDVVTENFSPGVMKRLGLDYENLELVKPDIIMVSMPGAGSSGPLRDTVSYAATISALCGLSGMVGYFGEEVLGNVQMVYCDTVTSVHAAFAILAALHYRSCSGEGQHIEIAQWEAATTLIGEAIMDYTMNSQVAGTQGTYHPTISPYNNYRCKGEDKWVSIAIASDEEWACFCEALGNPHWAREERFTDRYGRSKHKVELDKLISRWTIEHTPLEASEIMQKVKVAAVPVMNIEEQYFNPHYKARQTFVEIEHPLVGVEALPATPWRLSDTPISIRSRAPFLGEHNNYVFGQILGLSKIEISHLIDKGVIY